MHYFFYFEVIHTSKMMFYLKDLDIQKIKVKLKSIKEKKIK